MKRKTGFTLVEVAIAVSITVILSAIAIPRYNDLIRNQDFFAQLQEITSCLQRAQSLSGGSQGATLSSGNTIRWSGVQLASAGGIVTCDVLAFDSSVSFANLNTSIVSQLQTGSNSYTATDVTGITAVRRIYFGALERGLPVKDTSLAVQPSFGSGLSLNLPLTSSLDSTIQATITMGQSGAPIEIVRP